MNVEIADSREVHLAKIRQFPSYSRLTPTGVDYVEHALASPPSRMVGASSLMSMSGAVVSRFPYMVDYESSSCERPFVLLSIMDDRVFDLLSQPTQITVVKHDTRGRRRPIQYTPDYLCIRRDEIALVEAKPLQKLQKNAEASSDWIVRDGRWRYIPGDEAAAAHGMVFEVFCPQDFSPVYLTNLQYLVRASLAGALEEGMNHIEKARELLQVRPRTISQLCAQFSGLTGAVIYEAIKEKLLFGLIEHQLLEPGFMVYADQNQVDQQIKFLDRVRGASDSREIGPMQARLRAASTREISSAIERRDGYLKKRLSVEDKTATDYRIEAAIRAAAQEGADELAAFILNTAKRGRREFLPELLGAAIKLHAEKFLKAGRVPKLSKMYADFVVESETEGRYVPSSETYRQIYNSQMAPERAAFISAGKKAFHAARPRTDGAHAVTRLRIAGMHAHIDGVYGDVRSRPDEEGVYLRPIFYPIIDDATGYVFGRGIKLGRGTRLAVAMAHRDCYLRNGDLPSKIVHDWGNEFVNTFVPKMEAHFLVGYERRPKSAPRFGAMGEMFNAQFSAFLQNLVGGTYFDRLGRSADGDKKSRARAEMAIREIVEAADEWMFDIWNHSPIGDEKMSPEERKRESMTCFPHAFVKVEDSLLHRYETSLPLEAKAISYVSGFRYGGTGYSSAELPILIRNGDVPVDPRLDCMDPSIVYAMTSGGVIELRSLDFNRMSGLASNQRMEEMCRLIECRSVSARNQLERNKREAKLLRDLTRSQANQETESLDPEKDVAEESESPDFSCVDFNSPTELELYRR
jgi:transposase InsO family protein